MSGDEEPQDALSPRTKAALDKAGIHPDDAAQMHPDALAAVSGIGPVAIEEIKAHGELIKVERHTTTEAVAADTEHHPVADPPDRVGPPTVRQGTRSEDKEGRATHPERINPELAPPATMIHRASSYAPADHPQGVRWPYVLTRPAFTADHVRREAGWVVWLLPHEVAAFHRLVERTMHKALGVEGAAEPR